VVLCCLRRSCKLVPQVYNCYFIILMYGSIL
jgi:hypothetical protein